MRSVLPQRRDQVIRPLSRGFATLLLLITLCACHVDGPDYTDRKAYEAACADPAVAHGKRIKMMAHDATEYARIEIREEVDRRTRQVLVHDVIYYLCPRGAPRSFTCRKVSALPQSRYQFVETTRFLAQQGTQGLEGNVFIKSEQALDRLGGIVMGDAGHAAISDR